MIHAYVVLSILQYAAGQAPIGALLCLALVT